MDNEIIVQEQKYEVANPFANSAAFQELYDIGKMFAVSDIVPSSYRGKPMDCAIAVDMANRMQVSPMMVMQNLYIVKGKPTWSGQACMSMIYAARQFKNARIRHVGKEGDADRGCFVEAEYKDTGEIIKGTTVTMEMAEKEGWINKDGSKWKTMPEQMLIYRAAAFFARAYLPNALMGVYVEGEAEDAFKEKTFYDIPDVFPAIPEVVV